MASHRRPKQPSRTRVTVLTAAAATAVALSAQMSAHAAPAPSKKEDVKAQVDKLNEEQEQAAERYNGAKERADQLRKQGGELQDQVARGQEQMTQLQAGLAAVAGEQYRTGGIDPTVQLMLTSDPSGYLEQAASVAQATNSQTDALKGLQDQARRLDQQKAEAAAILASLDETTKDLNQAKADVNKKLQEANALLNTLSAADRVSITQGDGRASRDSVRVDLGTLPQASGYAGVAVAKAMGKQGARYVWGATGPNTFDCSGLMVWAYAQAGVSLPRTSQSQGNVGVRVPSLAEAQPGDLVVYGSDRHHVGMYIGNGLVVHAPHTGDVVKVMKADAMPINTIRRV